MTPLCEGGKKTVHIISLPKGAYHVTPGGVCDGNKNPTRSGKCSYTPAWEMTCEGINMRARRKFCCLANSCKGNTNGLTTPTTISVRDPIVDVNKRLHTRVLLQDGASVVKEVQFGRVSSATSPLSSSSGPVDIRSSSQFHRYRSYLRLLREIEGDVSSYLVTARESIPLIRKVQIESEVIHPLLEHDLDSGQRGNNNNRNH